MDVFDLMAQANCARLILVADSDSGLRAAIAIDSVVAGTSMGGIRTKAYPDLGAGIADVARLARAMSRKCAISGLPAGGAKCVVFQHDAMDRTAAFQTLGRHIQALGGLYRTAGDLGTTAEDLAAVGAQTGFVNLSGPVLGDATGDTVVNGIAALAAERGVALGALRVAVQGAGLIGAGVARRLRDAGARVILADVDAEKAESVAATIGAETLPADRILTADVDILSPCAVGDVITSEVALQVRAWGICGGANNQLASEEAGQILAQRGILMVPDFLASSGAVIVGAAEALPNCPPADQLIAQTESTAREILRRAVLEGEAPTRVAIRLAEERMAA